MGPRAGHDEAPPKGFKLVPHRPSSTHSDERRHPFFNTKPRTVVPPPPRRVFPEVKVGPVSPPRTGEWLFTCRPGSEIDLIEELRFTDEESNPHLAGPALVAASVPRARELAFARQGFEVLGLATGSSKDALADTISTRLITELTKPRPWALDVWVPDHDETNPLAGQADALEARITANLNARAPRLSKLRVANARDALAENGKYAQVCLMAQDRAAYGVVPARDAPSLARGGRLRVHLPDHAPSRAGAKLLEAFAWLDRAPEPNDLCVDLGAAPGGWTWVLLEHRARVVAIDPGDLRPQLMKSKGLTHLRADAFRFEAPEPPEETVDWLFCDMAFRPLEVAALLGKWARRGWARLLIANIKLPMRKKAEHLLRVREILELAGWKHVRARQLYHDRDEVTFAGTRV